MLIRLGILQWLEIIAILASGAGAFHLISQLPGIPRNFSHYFYARSACVYTGIGKGGTVTLFPGSIREIRLNEATFKGDRFHLFGVTFKPTIPHLLPDFRKVALPSAGMLISSLCGAGRGTMASKFFGTPDELRLSGLRQRFRETD